jgi:hypothetical protein
MGHLHRLPCDGGRHVVRVPKGPAPRGLDRRVPFAPLARLRRARGAARAARGAPAGAAGGRRGVHDPDPLPQPPALRAARVLGLGHAGLAQRALRGGRGGGRPRDRRGPALSRAGARSPLDTARVPGLLDVRRSQRGPAPGGRAAGRGPARQRRPRRPVPGARLPRSRPDGLAARPGARRGHRHAGRGARVGGANLGAARATVPRGRTAR